MLPESRLDILLGIQDGVVADIRIHSSRLVQASRLFAGRRPDEVLALLPTIFSLCGTAQALAGTYALEAATGLIPSPPRQAARRLLVLAETISEHGLGFARDWPALIGHDADLGAARRIKTAMSAIRPALYPDDSWRRPAGGLLRPMLGQIAAALDSAEAVLAGLMGADPHEALADAGAFRSWLSRPRGIAGELLMGLAEQSGFGTGRFLPMPACGPADLAARLAEDSGSYVAQPDCEGLVFETGPLARQRAHPLVASLLVEFGPALLPRLVARLVEAAQGLREMASLMQDLTEDQPDAVRLTDGIGIGLVEAARGQLVHRVELQEGRVIRYQILAPTEWNFHPAGPFARGLMGTRANAELEARARLLVHALDPCVACGVLVQDA